MNLSFIIQNKAAEVVRSLVRASYGKSHPQAGNPGANFSPVMARLCAQDQTPVLSSAALAHRGNGERTVAAEPPSKSQFKRPLRVFQVIEKSESHSRIDRMVISGSFTEVCAELDRLVAKESALH